MSGAGPTTMSFLSGLNPEQLQAVTHNPASSLQILAGPGSGKTKVLTSRIAYLILKHSMPPSSICAVTFTNKAANEMRERLTKIVGDKCTRDVRMGTFHALCAVFLRKYGNLVGLESNFTICDADESKKIISTLLKPHKGTLEQKSISLKEGTILSMISKAKAKRCTAAEFSKELERRSKSKDQHVSDIDYLIAEIYTEYERTLRRNNSLDFDDLLVYGVSLFTEHKRTVTWCKHVLVDEFQDTNHTQYDLMIALALDKCVTIVGDPDQSIYGWRSAEVENLAKMQKDFPETAQIFLEQNYRSTAAILKTSLAVIAQDKTRIQKSLHTLHPAGPMPVLRFCSSEYDEATFIAGEIKRLVAQMGGELRWGDFVVLLRFNALSRTIESALQKEGIPSRVLSGHKFFERLEIKNLLAYLQLIDNPSFDPALVRAVNVPSRGIGEKTLLEIAERAAKTRKPQLDVIEGICDGRSPDIKPSIKRKLVSFVKTVQTLREFANNGVSPADLIRRLLDLIEFEDHLKKTQPDWESRWENVQELITFASEVETDILNVGSPSPERNAETPLRRFLQASMLSSEGDNQNSEDSKEKVTISTCHAAKGLEWPVVMIPAVEEGTFPFYRSEDIEEERRLLYVACTRAQGLLYLSFTDKRKVAGDTKTKELSSFVSSVAKENSSLFSSWPPNLSPLDRKTISEILSRPVPDESEVSRRMTEFKKVMHHHVNQHATPQWHPPITAYPSKAGTQNDFITSNDILTAPKNRLLPAFTRPSANIPYVYNPSNVLQNRKENNHGFPTPVPSNAPQTMIPSRKLPPTAPIIQAVPSPQAATQPPQMVQASQGTKRRLGMGRSAGGYSNKKFKTPT